MKLLIINFFNIALISALTLSADFAAAQNPAPAQPAAKPAQQQPAGGQPGDNKKQGGNRKQGPGAVCRADRQMYCKGINGVPDRRACLMKNRELLSPACKEFISKVATGGGGALNPTPGPTPKSPQNKIEVNSATVPTKPAAKPATPAPAAPAAPAPTPEKK